jgi:hypothetical protein
MVYQQFIPPDVDESGMSQIYRLHMLLTPLRVDFLSVHRVVSNAQLPSFDGYGIIAESRRFVINRSTGGRYMPADRETEQEVRVVAEQLGAILDKAISSRFVTTWPPKRSPK